MKLKQQLQEEEETQVLEAEEQENPEKFMAFSTENPRSPLKKIKKKFVPKKPRSVKSKAKQVISDDRGKSGSCKKKRTRIEDLYDNDEAKCSVMGRADEVLENVADEYPSFIKCMLPSNVTHGFWLILPKKFCNLHLPMHDTTVILVDECGKEYEANFLVERHGLSGGWRGFSLAHRLLKGDILVFHLIKPCTLKVHIVRVYGLDEVDAALCLLNLVTHAKRTYSNKNCQTRKKAKKCVEPLLLDIHWKDIKTTGLVTNQYETNSDDFGSEESKEDATVGAKSHSLADQVLDLTQDEEGDLVSKSASPIPASSEAEVHAADKSLEDTLLEIDAEVVVERESSLAANVDQTSFDT